MTLSYKLKIIIFSYNRAIQLERLLKSIYNNWINPDFQIDVIYNTSSEFYENGYTILKQNFSQKDITFHKEKTKSFRPKLKEICYLYNFKRLLKYKKLRNSKTDFRDILLDIIKSTTCEFIMFLTDDSEFIEKVRIPEDSFYWLKQDDANRQYSLRIGKYDDDFPSNLVHEMQDNITWYFYDCPKKTNWGYPFSVDAHIYSKRVIEYLFNKLLFNNPNTLEGFVQNYVYNHRMLGQGRCSIKPVILSFPINMVQNVISNESLCISLEMLNNYYLQGYTLEYSHPSNPTRFQYYPENIYLRKEEEIITIKTHE